MGGLSFGIDIPPSMREKPPVLGVPVDMSRHPGLFSRSWDGIGETPYELPKPVIPRVRMAEVPEGKVPADAAKDAGILRAKGYELRFTYGVCGCDHREPDLGKCGTCGSTEGLISDGSVRKHIAPADNCSGKGLEPASVVTLSIKGKQVRRGVCPMCSEPNRLTSSGLVYAHGPVCDGSGCEPGSIVPGRELPPEETVALRVKRFGAAAWTDGKFDIGGVIAEDGGTRYVRMVKVTEWRRLVKAAGNLSA